MTPQNSEGGFLPANEDTVVHEKVLEPCGPDHNYSLLDAEDFGEEDEVSPVSSGWCMPDMCRVCAAESSSVDRLFAVFSLEGEQMNLVDKIHTHLPIKVTESDCLPLSVCTSCTNALNVCHGLLKTCLRADAELRHILRLSLIEHEKNQLCGAQESDVLENKHSDNSVMSEVEDLVAQRCTEDSREQMSLVENAVETHSEIAEETSDPTSLPINSIDLKVLKHFDDNDCVSLLTGSMEIVHPTVLSLPLSNVKNQEYQDDISHPSSIATPWEMPVFECSDCGHIGQSQPELEVGIRMWISHDGNNQSCDVWDTKLNRAHNCKQDVSLCAPDFQNEAKDSPNLIKELESFVCDICGFTCQKCEKFLEHRNVEHGISDTLQCGQCGEEMTDWQILQKHLQVHTENSTEKYPPEKDFEINIQQQNETSKELYCPFCNKQFSQFQHLEDHLRTLHSADRPYECSKCSMRFASRRNLYQHVATHDGARKYVCEKCGFCCNRRSNLSMHMKRHDGPDAVYGYGCKDIYSCKSCSLKFKKFRQIMEHVRTQHPDLEASDVIGGRAPHKCPICNKLFSGKKVLDTHLGRHMGNRPFICCYCSKCFAVKDELVKHELRHTVEKPFKCRFCDAAFKRENYRKTHEMIHTGLTPYECDQCGKCFRSSANLYQHKVIHSGEKKFHCQYCDYSTGRSEQLRNHIRTHTNERPFICKVCGRGFKQRGDKNTHERLHYRDDGTLRPVKSKQKQLRVSATSDVMTDEISFTPVDQEVIEIPLGTVLEGAENFSSVKSRFSNLMN